MERSSRNQLPLVAIVGKPNVGKSALFNRLIGRRKAIVDGQPGVTRDTGYARVRLDEREILLADSAGYVRKGEGVWEKTRTMNRVLIEEACCLVLVCDIQGLDRDDFDLAEQVRRSGKPVVLVVNKVDNPGRADERYDFYRLGVGDPLAVSALHGSNIDLLRRRVRDVLPPAPETLPPGEASGAGEHAGGHPIQVAIVGKPNVGKSSLLNLLAGGERSLVTPSPGTTRDTVDHTVRFARNTVSFLDTAGLRRRGKVRENVEYYATLRARDAIKRSTLCVQLIDAREGVTGQDKKITAAIVEARKGLILAANKWDLLEQVDERAYFREAAASFPHISFAPFIGISAKTGYNKTKLLDYIVRVYINYNRTIKTSQLNDRISGLTLHRARVVYGVQVRSGPPRFEFFIKHGDPEDENLRKFIANRLRGQYPFEGVPLEVTMRESP
ncbi:MAG: ribosome biogenesis GTPase Der [Spirochaetota bacterium]